MNENNRDPEAHIELHVNQFAVLQNGGEVLVEGDDGEVYEVRYEQNPHPRQPFSADDVEELFGPRDADESELSEKAREIGEALATHPDEYDEDTVSETELPFWVRDASDEEGEIR